MACSLRDRCPILVRWNISPSGAGHRPGPLAAAGVRVLNEKRLTERAGLDAIQDRLAQPGPDLGSLVSDVRARLELTDDVWAGG